MPFSPEHSAAFEVNKMPMPFSGGALFIGTILRLVVAVPVTKLLVLLLWKLGKLVDAYTEKLRTSSR